MAKKKMISVTVVQRCMFKVIRMTERDAKIFDKIASEQGLGKAYIRWRKKYHGDDDELWRERNSIGEVNGPMNLLVDM